MECSGICHNCASCASLAPRASGLRCVILFPPALCAALHSALHALHSSCQLPQSQKPPFLGGSIAYLRFSYALNNILVRSSGNLGSGICRAVWPMSSMDRLLALRIFLVTDLPRLASTRRTSLFAGSLASSLSLVMRKALRNCSVVFIAVF